LPGDQIEFDRIRGIIEETYRQFGFGNIDTPVIERSEVLLAKAGGETERQVYRFNKGDTDLSLRFDLTVPLARYVAEHFNELSFPFRRYQIGKVYRGESAQKGRYREFYQCDIDIVGKDKLGIYYDAEVPYIIYRLFRRLDFGRFVIRVSNRKILGGLMESLDLADKTTEVLRIIDKKDKVSSDKLVDMLTACGLESKAIEILVGFAGIVGSCNEVLGKLKGMNVTNEKFGQGIEELGVVTDMMVRMGVDERYFGIDLSIARGLDYYTGTVYETILVDHPQLGSVCSGGRYDNLASHYTDQRLPGVGISIGLTRLFFKLNELGLVSGSGVGAADVVVVPLGADNIVCALETGQWLRDNGYKVDVLIEDGTKIKEKFRYVAKKNAKAAIVIGDDEQKAGKYLLQRELADGSLEKKILTKAQAIKELKMICG